MCVVCGTVAEVGHLCSSRVRALLARWGVHATENAVGRAVVVCTLSQLLRGVEIGSSGAPCIKLIGLQPGGV